MITFIFTIYTERFTINLINFSTGLIFFNGLFLDTLLSLGLSNRLVPSVKIEFIKTVRSFYTGNENYIVPHFFCLYFRVSDGFYTLNFPWTRL